MLTGIEIEPVVTHKYELIIEYKTSEKEQDVLNNSFNGTFTIDIEEIDDKHLATYEVEKEITDNIPLNEFEVHNIKSNEDITYNILLDEIENTYEKGELTYKLFLEDSELSNGEVPYNDEYSYIYTDKTLEKGKTEKVLSETTNTLVAPTYSVASGYAKSKNVTINYNSSEGEYLFKTTVTSKSMYCYNCATSSAAATLTYSTTNVSSTATANYAKSGSGYARITVVGCSI